MSFTSIYGTDFYRDLHSFPTRRSSDLVAEDVEKVNPDLVVRDKEGKPYSVRYEQVNAMLLNEFLKEHKAFVEEQRTVEEDRKSTRLYSSHLGISYAVFCLKKKKNKKNNIDSRARNTESTNVKEEKTHRRGQDTQQIEAISCASQRSVREHTIEAHLLRRK